MLFQPNAADPVDHGLLKITSLLFSLSPLANLKYPEPNVLQIPPKNAHTSIIEFFGSNCTQLNKARTPIGSLQTPESVCNISLGSNSPNAPNNVKVPDTANRYKIPAKIAPLNINDKIYQSDILSFMSIESSTLSVKLDGAPLAFSVLCSKLMHEPIIPEKIVTTASEKCCGFKFSSEKS